MTDAGAPDGLPAQLTDAYQQTLFEVHLPQGRLVLSMAGLVHGHPSLLPACPLSIITAYNPGTERPGPASNEAADHRLVDLLRVRGYRFYSAAGYSPDRSHSEPSYAVKDLTRSIARELGGMFAQACVFYWQGGRGKLLWCAAPPKP